jgi:hypothetical protein
MENRFVETRGYEFYWDVASKGYEIVNKTLYNCPYKDEGATYPLDRYHHDWIFARTQLNKRKWYGELIPDAIDVTSPWLIKQQGQQYAGKSYELPGTPAVYRPLHDDPTLHRKFATLDTSHLESEVVRFANQYGMLGSTIQLQPTTPGVIVHGESLFRWRVEIEKMGVLLALWDWVERGQAGKLGQIILWREDYYSTFVKIEYKWKHTKSGYQILPLGDEDNSSGDWKSDGYGHVEDVLAQSSQNDPFNSNREFFRHYRKGDVLDPARHYLCEMLNYHLRGITPSLVPYLGYRISFSPDTLLDALWLMFMLEVDGSTRTCWYCRKPLEPSRKDNIYCSNNCKRMAHYYSKQRTEAHNERQHSQEKG